MRYQAYLGVCECGGLIIAKSDTMHVGVLYWVIIQLMRLTKKKTEAYDSMKHLHGHMT